MNLHNCIEMKFLKKTARSDNIFHIRLTYHTLFFPHTPHASCMHLIPFNFPNGKRMTGRRPPQPPSSISRHNTQPAARPSSLCCCRHCWSRCRRSRTYTNIISRAAGIKARCSFRLILVAVITTSLVCIYIYVCVYVAASKTAAVVAVTTCDRRRRTRRHISCKLSSLVMATVFERFVWIIRGWCVCECVAYMV